MNRRLPEIHLSTNIVGGLGNQLFLLANLHATALRLRKAGDRRVVAHVEKTPLSSSCHEPRPTYWNTPLMRNVHECIVDSQSVQPKPPAGSVRQVAERGAAAAPFASIEDLRMHALQPAATSEGSDLVESFNFVGFFQSDRYFADLRDAVVDTLRPPALADEAARVVRKTQEQQQHVVGIHVRRGDYLLLKDTFEILSHEYYFKAMETLFGATLFREPQPSSLSSSARRPIKALVFGEDEVFGRVLSGALRTKYPAVDAEIVDAATTAAASTSSSGSDEWRRLPQECKEMLMMAACDDVVIANSSFSWWGAYMAHTAAPTGYCRVVAPQRWFVGKELTELAHVYPSDWVVV